MAVLSIQYHDTCLNEMMLDNFTLIYCVYQMEKFFLLPLFDSYCVKLNNMPNTEWPLAFNHLLSSQTGVFVHIIQPNWDHKFQLGDSQIYVLLLASCLAVKRCFSSALHFLITSIVTLTEMNIWNLMIIYIDKKENTRTNRYIHAN